MFFVIDCTMLQFGYFRMMEGIVPDTVGLPANKRNLPLLPVLNKKRRRSPHGEKAPSPVVHYTCTTLCSKLSWILKHDVCH